MSQNNARLSVMMVCLGNICRSPTAHGLLRQRLAEAGLTDAVDVASSGIGTWHIGSAPDARAQAEAAARGIDIADLRARKIEPEDLDRFDYVIAMDHDNQADLLALAGSDASRRNRIHLLGDFSDQHAGQPVGDPYYGGDAGFARVFEMIDTCVTALTERLAEELRSAGKG
tara:strand:- start:534 stop:1046 length:513 start_codon:yes stop_codon:yes gene_type:complete